MRIDSKKCFNCGDIDADHREVEIQRIEREETVI